jgi:hypothetical protein
VRSSPACPCASRSRRRARALYARHGFGTVAPFGDYGPNPHSVHLTLDLADGPAV